MASPASSLILVASVGGMSAGTGEGGGARVPRARLGSRWAHEGEHEAAPPRTGLQSRVGALGKAGAHVSGRETPAFPPLLRPELRQHLRSLCRGTQTGTSCGLVPSACIAHRALPYRPL